MSDIATFVRLFEQSEQASQDGRRDSEQARDYYDSRQLTAGQMAALKRKRQPIVIENLIRPKVDGLAGLERQTRTDPKCYPRNYGDEQSANIATDALRYVSDDQKFDIKRSRVFENMLIEGFGGVEVGVRRARGGIDPQIIHIAWDRLFFDPHSCQADFSDANYKGYVTWMDEADARARWQDAENAIADTMTNGSGPDTYDDKPRWAHWSDSKRKRVRVVTLYRRGEGGWTRAVFTRGGMLEPEAPSPFLNEDGEPECPLIMQSAYIDRDNDRYGIVRDMISLQDEVNKRRSKALHLVSSRQVRVARHFEGNVTKIRDELAKPDGVVAADKDELEPLSTMDLSTGQFQLLQDARISMRGIGPNAHMQGKEGDGQSGRAILAMQQAGMTEMAPLLDGLRDFNIRVFTAVWNRIRQYWNEERWVRITDDESAIRFVGVNTTRLALAETKIAEAANAGQIDPVTAQGYLMQVRNSPEMYQPANVVAELDVDIQIDEVQNTPTLHIEQFEALTQLAATGMVPIPPELIIQASNLRDKDKLLEILEQQKQQQAQIAQQPNPMAELQARGLAARATKDEATAMLTAAKAQNEAMAGQVVTITP